MGFFDTPCMVIKKWLPVDAYFDFDFFLNIVQSNPDISEFDTSGFKKNKKEFAYGFIMSIWACNSCCLLNKFQLKDFDFRYIKNMGLNCFNALSEIE